MSHLAISLMGPFQVTRDGEPAAVFESDTARALLAYLALHADTPCPREMLAGLLWPEWPNSEALRNLRVALSRLRDAIVDREAEPPYLHITRKTLQFSAASDHWLDVTVLSEAVAASKAHAHRNLESCSSCMARLEEAAALYRGDFLAGFSLDSTPFEEWLVVQRESLHLQVLEALHHLALYREGQGKYGQALHYARRQVELEPWRESAHRQWMRALALSGQRGAAMAQHEACRQVLADELGVEPEAETVALYEQIRDGKLALPRQVEAPLPVSALIPSPASAEPSTPPGLVPAFPPGERRLVTVLHAEVGGSAALLDEIGPDRWTAALGDVFQFLDSTIHRYDGEVYERREDGLIALFGVPLAHEDDPERAVLAALEVQEQMAAHAGERPVPHPALCLGIDSGELLITYAGDRRQVVGRALTLAQRARVQAGPGTVVVGQNAYRLVRPLFEWETLGEDAVGRLYRPLARRALQGKGRGIQGLDSPLVGRDGEFRALSEAVERLRAGGGGIVTLVGEAGLGKSRLVTELRASVGSLPKAPLQWVEGGCLSYTTDVAYRLWLDLVHRLLDAPLDALPTAVRETLREQVESLCADCEDDVYPFVARMMRLPLDTQAEARLRGLDAEGLQTLTFDAVGMLIECAARRRPLVLVCEDLHWADPTSLALLEHLLPLTDRVPLLFICVFRPEKEHGCWRIKETAGRLYGHRHTDLWLDPLTEQEGVELVGHLLKIEDLPETLRVQILEYAGGNPFYVEETLRSLIDADADGGAGIAYDKSAGRWHAAQDLSEIALPDTLHSLLAARIDRLPTGAKQVLQLASVLGHVFSHPLLAAVAERGRLDDELVTLQRAQMIREQARIPQLTYTFHHVLTQQAAYAGLLRRARRTLHRRTAEALERLFPEQIEEQIGLLAHHWERSGDADKAIPYLRRAGEQAAAQFANAEAVIYFSRALELTPEEDLSVRYALLSAREAVYDVQGNREAQRRDLQALAEMAGTLDDGGPGAVRRRARVALREANYGDVISDYPASVDAAQRAIHLAQSIGDMSLEAEGYLRWGRALIGDDQAAQSLLEKAMSLARRAGRRTLEADALRELSQHSWHQEAYDQARDYLDRALLIWREVGNRMQEGRVLAVYLEVAKQSGDWAAARADAEQALHLYRLTGNRREATYVLGDLGSIFWAHGDYAQAQAYYERGLRSARQVGDRFGESLMLSVWLALNAYRMGEYGACLNYAQQGLEIADEIGAEKIREHVCRSRGHALENLGRLDEAREAYQYVLARNQGRAWAMDMVAGLARISLAEGDLAQALAHVEQILDTIQVKPALHGAYEPFLIFLTCYRVLHAAGDTRAGEVLERAYRLIQERAAQMDDEGLRQSFLENVKENREIVALWQERQADVIGNL